MQSLIQYRRLEKVAREHQKAQAQTSHACPDQFDPESGDQGVPTDSNRPMDLADGVSITGATNQCPTSSISQDLTGDKTIEVKSETGDGTDPHQWSHLVRFRALAILWFLVFALGWVSTCDSNLISQSAPALHVSEEAETLSTALFLFGIAAGSCIVGPISEQIGRNAVYLPSVAIYLCFLLGSGLAPNFGAQLAFRFLSGLFSSPTLSLYGGSMADLYEEKLRAVIWPSFALSPLLGKSSAELFKIRDPNDSRSCTVACCRRLHR